MQALSKPIKIGWAIFKWLLLVVVITGLVSSIIAVVLLGLQLLVASVAPQLLGPVEAWTVILLVAGFLASFIFVAYLAAHRAVSDVEKAYQDMNS